MAKGSVMITFVARMFPLLGSMERIARWSVPCFTIYFFTRGGPSYLKNTFHARTARNEIGLLTLLHKRESVTYLGYSGITGLFGKRRLIYLSILIYILRSGD